MLTESFILLILVVVFCYFTLRSGRQGMVLLMLPLLSALTLLEVDGYVSGEGGKRFRAAVKLKME